MEIFCFFIGILYSYTYNFYLPLIVLLFLWITPKYQIILLFVIGIVISLIHQWVITPKGIPEKSVIPYAQLEGRIASIPTQNKQKTQFSFNVEKINGNRAQGILQLSWYNNAPPIHTGQHWLLTAKIKKPRNFLNPGSSDYARSLNTRHIFWTGYVRSKNNKLLKDKPRQFHWLLVREYLGNALEKLSPTQQTAGIVQALTLNLTTNISKSDWDLFRRTGTIHVFGISGEHIALISGLVTFIIRWLWSRSVRCCLLFPAISIASVAGLMTALVYAFLAGFEPPVQRALIGCFFYTLYYLGKQQLTPWQIWRYALFGVLCIEPHAVFMQGFYFSFLAVACLFLTHQRWKLKGYKGNLSLQLSCLLGLMPLTLFWFSYGSINGFIANLFAIPLVGFLIVPLALITMLTTSFDWSWILMKPLSWLIDLLFQGLIWTEHLAGVNILWSIHSILFVLSLMGGMLMLVLLPVKPFRNLALLWLLAPLFPPRTILLPGEVIIHILDVGQGLSVSIQTQNHRLLYDTGDQFFQGSDLGSMVILPYYQHFGIKTVDKIVISHPDKDHQGGLKSIEAGIKVNELIVNDPHYYKRGFNCHTYPKWTWDGVSFRFLPIHAPFKEKNNNSCILQINNSVGRILLTGDIEKIAEDYLVKTYSNQLSSDYLIVPHHGSKTSSSYRFLLEVAPLYAIASLGFDNRFHFPHAPTLKTMHALNIPFIRTDECGMVKIFLPAQGKLNTPICYNGLKVKS